MGRVLPAARLKHYLDDSGEYVKVVTVERWNPFVKRRDGGMGIRQDLLGVIDLLGLHKDGLLDAFQATVGDRHADHKAKILSNEYARWWASESLSKGSRRFFLVSYRKGPQKRGSKRIVWQPPRIEEFTEKSWCGGGGADDGVERET